MFKNLIIFTVFAVFCIGCSEGEKKTKTQNTNRTEKTAGSRKKEKIYESASNSGNKTTDSSSDKTTTDDKDVYKEALKAEIKDVNAKLPVKVEEGVTVTSFTVEGNDAVYYYMCEEPKVSMDAILQAQQKMKVNTRQSLQTTNDPETIHLLRMLRGSGMGLIFRYKGTKSGRTVDVSYSSAELEF